MKTKFTMNKKEIKWHIFLVITIFFVLVPIFFAISNSFKTLNEAYNNMMAFIPKEPTLENYKYIFTRVDILKITGNTLFIATCVTTFKVLTSLLAAYAFVFLNFKYKNVIYFILIATIFIPFTVTMIPNYLTISKINLTDNLWGVILPQLGDALGIFLLRQSMKMIPKSLIEYARLERLSNIRIMKDIVVPLLKPSIISSAAIFFINSWNEYVWPVLILKSKENYTLSLALQMYINSEGGTEFTIAMAISVLTMLIPLVLYLVFQKHIISTFTSSGIKG